MLNLIRPDKFPNYYQFGHRYGAPKKNPFSNQWEFKGASNIAELHDLLTDPYDGVLLRRRKIDVMQDLPEKIRSVLPVDMDRPQEYRKAVREFRRWLMEKKPSSAEKSWRAEALVKVGYLRRLAAELKLPAIYSWIGDFLATGNKLIVFGVHKAILQPIYDRYKSCAVIVDGSVTGSNRQGAVDRFNNSPACRLFVGNVRAAGTGWSARDCSTTLFVELDWTPTAMAQAGDRTHGIGRGRGTESSLDVYLIARGSIEERVLGILDVKQKNIDRIIDGADAEEDSIFLQLLDEFRQEPDLFSE
jgi:SNF2 family DNA or RNA helicase